MRDMRVYELVAGKGGPKIQPVTDGAEAAAPAGGFRFHGELRQFADLLAVQISIPGSNTPILILSPTSGTIPAGLADVWQAPTATTF